MTHLSMIKLPIILFIVISNVIHGVVEGLRLRRPAISGPPFLFVGVPATFRCDYIKFQSESILEINWYAGYNETSKKVRVNFY